MHSTHDMSQTPYEREQELERRREERIRELMNKRRITYQEAEKLVKDGQRALGDFR